METPLESRCLVPGRMKFPRPEADRRFDDLHTSAGTTDAGARGARSLFQLLPRASIRLGLAPRQAPPREVLTPRRSCRVLALISG